MSEDRNRSFMIWAPVGFFYATRNGTITAANPALAEMLGFSSSSELVGWRLSDLVVDDPDGRALLDKILAGHELRAEESSLLDSAESRVPVLLSCRRLRDGDGAAGELEGVVQDIRHRTMLEQELRQSQKLEAVGRLAGGMAHDFNNLLMIVQGRAELALRTLTPSDPAVRHLDVIHRTAFQAESLTRQLLAFSRRQMLRPRTMSINAVIADTQEMIVRWLGEDIELKTSLEPELWPVRADPVQIQQVVINLVVNAREAMPNGGELHLVTKNVAGYDWGAAGNPPSDAIRLVAQDSGNGMDADTLALIFEPFFTTKGQGQGTGLGLSTAYGVVKQSGGVIEAESEPGRGSRFTIHLPRTSGPTLSHWSPQPVRPTFDVAQPAEPAVILLVEDENDLRLVLKSFIEEMGHHVIAAADADVVLRSLGPDARVDLLLTDVVLPTLNGIELAERLRDARPGLPVIFMSGFAGHPLVSDEITDAGHPLLMKPFTRSELTLEIAEVLARSSESAGEPIPTE